MEIISGTTIELFNTDGAIGAARGAGIGAGFFKGPEEAFANLKTVKTISPDAKTKAIYSDLYEHWKNDLLNNLQTQ